MGIRKTLPVFSILYCNNLFRLRCQNDSLSVASKPLAVSMAGVVVVSSLISTARPTWGEQGRPNMDRAEGVMDEARRDVNCEFAWGNTNGSLVYRGDFGREAVINQRRVD